MGQEPDFSAQVILNRVSREREELRWKKVQKRLLPLMTRPVFRNLVGSIVSRFPIQSLRGRVSDFDVLHYVGTGWDLIGFSLIRHARRFGKLVTCLPAIHPGAWGDSSLDVLFYRRLNAIFALSDFEKCHLTKLGVDERLLVRSGCGVAETATGDGSRFRAEYGLEGRQLVLFVGRKSVHKGYHELVRAVGALGDDMSNLTLVSIGRPVEPPFPQLPSTLHLDLEVATDRLKHDALAACDVFALPSSAESFGIVYLEAWSYGKPVVCGTAPASRELVNRHHGGLASDGSATDIAAKLKHLLKDSALCAEMGQAGKAAVTAEYTLARVAENHMRVWKSLISA